MNCWLQNIVLQIRICIFQLGITSFGFLREDGSGCVNNDVPQVFAKVLPSTEFLLRGNQCSQVAGWKERIVGLALILFQFQTYL